MGEVGLYSTLVGGFRLTQTRTQASDCGNLPNKLWKQFATTGLCFPPSAPESSLPLEGQYNFSTLEGWHNREGDGSGGAKFLWDLTPDTSDTFWVSFSYGLGEYYIPTVL